jgi:hypothetical protein
MKRCLISVALCCLAGIVEISQAQNWVQLTPATGDAPAPRVNAAAIYDSLNHRLIVFGGKATTGNLNDVWAFDLANNSWSNYARTALHGQRRLQSLQTADDYLVGAGFVIFQ